MHVLKVIYLIAYTDKSLLNNSSNYFRYLLKSSMIDPKVLKPTGFIYKIINAKSVNAFRKKIQLKNK